MVEKLRVGERDDAVMAVDDRDQNRDLRQQPASKARSSGYRRPQRIDSSKAVACVRAGRSPRSVFDWQGGSEEVGEQLRDTLGLVVVHPVRGVGQALDAVQAGHVIVVGLG